MRRQLAELSSRRFLLPTPHSAGRPLLYILARRALRGRHIAVEMAAKRHAEPRRRCPWIIESELSRAARTRPGAAGKAGQWTSALRGFPDDAPAPVRVAAGDALDRVCAAEQAFVG